MSQPLARARLVLTGLALCATASLGALTAALAPGARADLLPAPTLPTTAALPPTPSVPSLPVTVPTVPLPGGTTTGPAGGDSDPGSTSGSNAANAATGTTQSSARTEPAGAVHLGDGSVSIPASSAVLPLRMLFGRVPVQPTRVTRLRQRLQSALRVTDSRGYVVRGIVVEVRSSPAGRITNAARRSAIDGSVRLAFRTTGLLPLRTGVRLRVQFRAGAVRHVVVVPVVPAP